jgi:hypothetical protein
MPKADCDNKNGHKFKFYEGIYNNYAMLNAAYTKVTQHTHIQQSAAGRVLEARQTQETAVEGGGLCRQSSVRSLSEKPVR